MRLAGIYAISSEILTPYEILPQCLESALQAGVKIFQLRDKTHSDEWLYPHAKALIALCERYNALFVVNDRLSLALRLGANALHLGKDDGQIVQARQIFKGILGASSYDSLKRAQDLESIGVDYVAFGAFFPSLTKPEAMNAPIEILASAKKDLHIPVCAIGGISAHNISLLKNAHMHAVISALWGEKWESNSPTSALDKKLDSIFFNIKALQNALL